MTHPTLRNWLPVALYSAAQTRALDRAAIERHGIAGETLMERAGAAAFELLQVLWPRARRIAVVCGTGNNGGDGYVIARLARRAGMVPLVLEVGEARTAPGDAATMRARCREAGVEIRVFDSRGLAGVDVVVDALLGTGLQRLVQGPPRDAIDAMNGGGAPILAVDVPSGLNADTGAVMGAATRAQATLSYIGLKAGLFTGSGREHVGAIYFDDLGVPQAVYAGVTPVAQRLDRAGLRTDWPRRAQDIHKGDAGHVLVVGGNAGMPGAARLAAETAYRVGAGLVTVATHPSHASVLNAARPELIVAGVRTAKNVQQHLERADAVALGPGLGQDRWAEAVFRAVCRADVPLVVDADALNLLSATRLRRADWVLTPHPGEAARLLGSSVTAVQGDRFAAARAIAVRYGGVCVLKGSGTVVADASDAPADLCDRGNPGMASGGMGDVLTGIVAGLLAQGLAARAAARLGVWLHAGAADAAVATTGEAGLLASDLMAHLRGPIAELTA